jgi:hypothetical protein
MTSARCQRLRLPSELRDMRPIAELLCEQLPAEATTMKTNTLRVREESWRKTPFDRKAVQCGYATQTLLFRPARRKGDLRRSQRREVRGVHNQGQLHDIVVVCGGAAGLELATRLGDRPWLAPAGAH